MNRDDDRQQLVFENRQLVHGALHRLDPKRYGSNVRRSKKKDEDISRKYTKFLLGLLVPSRSLCRETFADFSSVVETQDSIVFAG